MTLQRINARRSNRHGAALITALVLLLLVGAISTSLIRGFYTDRLQRDQSLVRTQAEMLKRDFAERAKIQLAASPDFTGETLTMAGLSSEFDGTFQLTSSVIETPDGAEPVVVVEYYNAANKLVLSAKD